VKKFIIIICLLFVVQSCGPFLGTIGIVSLGAHSKQKGIGTTINDNIIKTKISNFIFKFDENLIPDTKIFVNNGSVLFTGKVKVPESKIEITKLAWSVKGVKEVNNELQVIDKSSIKNIARDLASLGEIRARLITDKSINSLNFSIDVVNDKVYLSGVAKDKSEMIRVKDHAVSARFIKEVYNYIILDNDIR
jgi:osmotically-inducible protein OsmY